VFIGAWVAATMAGSGIAPRGWAPQGGLYRRHSRTNRAEGMGCKDERQTAALRAHGWHRRYARVGDNGDIGELVRGPF